MTKDDKCTFAVIVTWSAHNYRQLVFVRAASLEDAYKQVLTGNLAGSFQTDKIAFEGFVVGSEQLLRASAVDMKAFAQAYWEAAQRGDATFAETWEEHGLDLVDEA